MIKHMDIIVPSGREAQHLIIYSVLGWLSWCKDFFVKETRHTLVLESGLAVKDAKSDELMD